MDRLGETDAMLSMLDYVTERLLYYGNAELQFFMAETKFITDLDSYADHIHAAGKITFAMAKAMPQGTYCMTVDNRRAYLDALQEFVQTYDYDAIWEEHGG